ncbi:type II toxin-antitoxin system Phd/YefM family antitoxin [Photobacterium leiognathi]|uniref:type II toxin-antitoxin system Phd/YefM family antitoxin n=1 Tax=Photobacterium leiognathi TaxID=553611 RepID=UPI00298298C1|nr:type II toxin-antitoxin system Phd/YefM family antitoxin [Photobacterium leiognathi]
MIETISYLKKNAADLPLDEPLTITQNGKPAYVVCSYEEYQRREQAIALMKMVSFAEADVKNDRVMSSNSFKERLAARKE